jgi:netrin 1
MGLLQLVLILSLILIVNSFDYHQNRRASIQFARPNSNNDYFNDPCYDQSTGVAKRCIPQFENVAYQKKVIASSTCGDGVDDKTKTMNYCIIPPSIDTYSSVSTKKRQCGRCDSNNQQQQVNTSSLTDSEESRATCWVSGPIDNPSLPSNLSLVLSFGKKYELTYISLKFCTLLKPDSLAIMKSMNYGKTWIPFQFYSSDCQAMFNRPLKANITKANEQVCHSFFL